MKNCLPSLVAFVSLAFLPGCGRGGAASEAADTLYYHGYLAPGMFMNGHFYPGNMTWDYYYLGKNGRVYRDVPTGGLDPVDWDALKAKAKPGEIGNFTIDGGKIHLRWDDGKTADLDFHDDPQSKSTIIGDAQYVRAGRFADGHPLDGTFEFGTTSNVTIPGGVSSAAVSTTFRFHSDGTFDGGSVTTVEHRDAQNHAEDVAGGAGNKQTGRYHVAGNTLQMTFPDGRQEKHTVFCAAEEVDKTTDIGVFGIDSRVGLFK